MNKVIIYSNPSSVASLLGLGLKVISYDQFKLEPDTRYLVLGQEAYNYIASQVHLGLRGSRYWYITWLKRVGVHNGSSFIFKYDSELESGLDLLNSDDLEKVECGDPPKLTYITKADDAKVAFDNLKNDPLNWYGFDYESDGLPEYAEFILTGLGISTRTQAYWFDYRYMDDLSLFLSHLREFLREKSHRCLVFNVRFELIATYRYLQEYFDFKDINAINVLKQYGNWMNLKWTARNELNVLSWDDDFDGLARTIDECIHDGKLNLEELKAEYLDYLTEDEYREIYDLSKIRCSGYWSQPMNKLGTYCALDCFYTLEAWMANLDQFNWDEAIATTPTGLMIDKLEEDPEYNKLDEGFEDADSDTRAEMLGAKFDLRREIISKNALDVYTDGKLFEARVNHQGMIKDVAFWDRATKIGDSLLLIAGTNLCIQYAKDCIDYYKPFNDIEKYSGVTAKFIKEGIDVTQGGFYLSKYLFTSRYYNENCEWNLDDKLIKSDFGDEAGQELIDMLWSCVDSLDNIGRKRTCHEWCGGVIDKYINVPDDLKEYHDNTIQHYKYLDWIDKISKLPWVGTHYLEMKDTYMIDGEEYTLKEAFEYMKSYVNFHSAENNNWMYETAFEKYKNFLVFNYVRYYEYDKQLWDSYTGDYCKDYEIFSNNADKIDPEKLQEVLDYAETCSDCWISGNVWRSDHFSYLHYASYHYPDVLTTVLDHVAHGTWADNYLDFFIYMMYKRIEEKYYKMIGTYFRGTFYSNDINYDTLDRNWDHNLVDYSWDPTKPTKSFAYYEANKQFSMRWSSGYHTVPSKSECKVCCSTPDDALLSYFDISQAEVRSQAYLFEDKKMVECYEQGIDLYILCSKVFDPDEDYDDPETYAECRGQFKVVLLALTYLRSAPSLAEELGVDTSVAKEQMNVMFEMFPQLKSMIDYLKEYPIHHDGNLRCILGEWINSAEEPARQRRHGINTVVQGFTAVALVHGFYNLLRVAKKEGMRLQPVSVVHDSCCDYFDVKDIVKIVNFYKVNFTDFLYSKFRVRYKFSTLVGTSYYDACDLSSDNVDTIELKGKGRAINKILDKFDLNGVKYDILNAEDLKLNESGNRVVEKMLLPLEAFYDNESKEATFEIDKSKYKIKLKIYA